jgi:hypothetical protein
MSKPVPHFVVTANRLTDGLVLYVGAGPAWVPSFQRAELTADAARRDELLAWAKADVLHVCGVYVVDVPVDGGEPKLSQRERLRAAGPLAVLSRLALTPPDLAARTASTPLERA